MPLNRHATISKERTAYKNAPVPNETNTHHKVLFMSRLRNQVTIRDIRNHFIGCAKVTVKRHRSAPHLKYPPHIDLSAICSPCFYRRYAFIVHRTSGEAERNLQRPIDNHLFGNQSRVEYASVSSSRYNFNRSKMVVNGIPQHVTKNDLRHLFTDCHVLKYCPASTVYLPPKPEDTQHMCKTSLGYVYSLNSICFCLLRACSHSDQCNRICRARPVVFIPT